MCFGPSTIYCFGPSTEGGQNTSRIQHKEVQVQTPCNVWFFVVLCGSLTFFVLWFFVVLCGSFFRRPKNARQSLAAYSVQADGANPHANQVRKTLNAKLTKKAGTPKAEAFGNILAVELSQLLCLVPVPYLYHTFIPLLYLVPVPYLYHTFTIPLYLYTRAFAPFKPHFLLLWVGSDHRRVP